MTVDAAWEFFADEPQVRRSLAVLRQVGLGYLRLGQPATELSGGEAQRIKLATELQRAERGNTLYVLDEPTTGLHPSDVERLMTQLDGLVDAGQHGRSSSSTTCAWSRQRLGDRHRPRRGRRGRTGRGIGTAPGSRPGSWQPHGRTSLTISRRSRQYRSLGAVAHRMNRSPNTNT